MRGGGIYTEHYYRQNIRWGSVISFYSIFPKCNWFYFTGYDLNKMRGGGVISMEHIYRQNIRVGGVISFYSIFPKCSWLYFNRYDLNKMRGGVLFLLNIFIDKIYGEE